MYDPNRKIEDLLADYAEALRDGYVPVFLRSLLRGEGAAIHSSREFWESTEVVRILNWVSFAEKATTPDVSLFISRTNARIRTRVKRMRRPARRRVAAEFT